jgi:hypothetical protein
MAILSEKVMLRPEKLNYINIFFSITMEINATLGKKCATHDGYIRGNIAGGKLTFYECVKMKHSQITFPNQTVSAKKPGKICTA